MIELNASFKSVETSVTQVQASYERSALSIQSNGVRSNNQPPPPTPASSVQQQQLVDEVDISAEALQKFEEATALADQLQNYLDYLNGTSSEPYSVSITPTANDNSPDITIAGEQSKLSASITVATYEEKTLDINAKFDDAGNLQELSIDTTSITAKSVKAELITEQRQFFAQA